MALLHWGAFARCTKTIPPITKTIPSPIGRLNGNTGLILLSTGARFQGTMETNKEDSLTIRFDDEDLFRQFIGIKYGTLSRDENGRRIIYCVNYLPSQDWYYIEKIDVTATVPETFF